MEYWHLNLDLVNALKRNRCHFYERISAFLVDDSGSWWIGRRQWWINAVMVGIGYYCSAVDVAVDVVVVKFVLWQFEKGFPDFCLVCKLLSISVLLEGTSSSNVH